MSVFACLRMWRCFPIGAAGCESYFPASADFSIAYSCCGSCRSLVRIQLPRPPTPGCCTGRLCGVFLACRTQFLSGLSVPPDIKRNDPETIFAGARRQRETVACDRSIRLSRGGNLEIAHGGTCSSSFTRLPNRHRNRSIYCDRIVLWRGSAGLPHIRKLRPRSEPGLFLVRGRHKVRPSKAHQVTGAGLNSVRSL